MNCTSRFTDVTGTITDITALGCERAGFPPAYAMEIETEEMTEPPLPGQFAMVGTSFGTEPFLPRPLGIVACSGHTLTFLIRTAGIGTRVLYSLYNKRRGVIVRAPLGRAISVPPGARVWYMAGGVGASPLIPSAVAEKNTAGFIMGVQNDTWRQAVEWVGGRLGNIPFHPASDDGSIGTKGNTVDMMRALCGAGDVVVACGPPFMLKKAHEAAADMGVRLIVGLERLMGCGFGGCHGCQIERTGGGHVFVCTDGAFFDSTEVVL